MRKYLEDLTFDEMVKLIKNNDYIYSTLFDRASDDAYYWVGEYLTHVPRHDVDYEYFGRGEHFTVEDVTHDFMDWVEDVQKDYEWLDESTYEKCKSAYELWKANRYERDLTDEEWEEYDRLKDEIGDEIFALMKSEYDAAFDYEVLVDKFSTYYDEIAEDGDYVDMDTWEIHNIYDDESDNLDIDLDEQLEIPIE